MNKLAVSLEPLGECVTGVLTTILMSSVICCYSTGTQQHGVFLFFIIRNKKKLNVYYAIYMSVLQLIINKNLSKS